MSSIITGNIAHRIIATCLLCDLNVRANLPFAKTLLFVVVCFAKSYLKSLKQFWLVVV